MGGVVVFIAPASPIIRRLYALIWNQQSASGRMLDPIADKLLVSPAC